jgi:hypothetical protein
MVAIALDNGALRRKQSGEALPGPFVAQEHIHDALRCATLYPGAARGGLDVPMK